MSDIERLKAQIRKISKGIVSDVENDSKDPEIVLSNLENVKNHLIELRGNLPCTTTGGVFWLNKS